ncbi:MAG: DNA adenine methylase [Methanospirillum sp.]
MTTSPRFKGSDSSLPGARPFLKWAGGKTQLLHAIEPRLPRGLTDGTITRYVEPFVGSGAVFFFVNHRFPLKECFLYDINEELVILYQAVKRDVADLIEQATVLADEYAAASEMERQDLFYRVRKRFNDERTEIDPATYSDAWVERGARLLFLNKTCFNGLFRVNARGEFNAPFGKYRNPAICNPLALEAASRALANTEILLGDSAACAEVVDGETFVYFDPPYRPLNATSSFTSYAKHGFSDDDQVRLARLFASLDKRGAALMLSNSDPRNHDPGDRFFDDLYSAWTIERVPARRSINCRGDRRGAVAELIIRNYG